jgi:nicotinamidase/pyrazinamidase
MSDRIAPGDADVLLVVDVQNDFCSGGALAVPGGEAVVPVINRLAAHFAHVVLTQDWHPPGHHSFASTHGRPPLDAVELGYGRQILWPDHCVQGSPGAAFHHDLEVPGAELVLRKGFRREIDSYSAFVENDHRTPTGLAGYLRDRGLRRVFLAGLAFDFCVLWSAQDALKLGFEPLVVEDACRAIDVAGSAQATGAELGAAGVRRLAAEAIR